MSIGKTTWGNETIDNNVDEWSFTAQGVFTPSMEALGTIDHKLLSYDITAADLQDAKGTALEYFQQELAGDYDAQVRETDYAAAIDRVERRFEDGSYVSLTLTPNF